MFESLRLPPIRIRPRIALALCGIATLATLLTLEIPNARLRTDLERAGQHRLDQAAGAMGLILADAQRRIGERHLALSRTPEFRANLETADVETLTALANELVRREDSIDAVVFSNSEGRPFASAGDTSLRRSVTHLDLGTPKACSSKRSSACVDATGGIDPILLSSAGRLVLGTSVPLSIRGRFVGRVTLLEIQSPTTLASWSRLSGASIELIEPDQPLSAFDRVVVEAPPLVLVLRGSFEPEQTAVARLRSAVLSAGFFALVVAFILAGPLSASLVAPLRAIEHAAIRIREGDLTTRLRSERDDEFGEVADAIDTMLDHLQATRAGLERAQQIGRLGSWRWRVGDPALETSPQLASLLELPAQMSSIGLDVFLRKIHPDDRVAFETAWRDCECAGLPIRIDHRIDRIDGSVLSVSTRGERVDLPGGGYVVEGTVQDVTEQRRSEERIRTLAFEDSLTGLGNRRAFADRLRDALEESRRELRPLALLFLDLDDFKIVNDTLGHAVGDVLLGVVAEELLETVAELGPRVGRASVHRLGGDEFALLLPDLDDLETVRVCAETILRRLSSPVSLGDYEVVVSASVGIATWPDEGLDVDSLLLGCDTAMYHAKLQGRGRYRFYDPSMRATSERRLHLESRMRQAIDRDEFDVVYQPKVHPESGRVVGFEALLRWRDPVLGLVSPAEFVGVAEETGQIIALGEWALANVVEQARCWHESGVLEVPISVNVSALQIESSSLLDTLVSALRESGLPPHLIDLEVTETALMRFEHRAIEILHELKHTGVSISLDDFGTGYSSLAYLRRLPIDAVKIDRSFVVAIAEEERDRRFVESIHSMARVLGLRVVVEGVETAAQRDLLRAMGCHAIQGYFYSAGVPASDVPDLARHGFTDEANPDPPETRS